MESFDVIIIGAGPAGLKCAETLGGSGLDVLVLEKNKVIGHKICAGGFTALNKGLDLPFEKMKKFATQHMLLDGKMYRIVLKNPLMTMDRYELGQFQLRAVKRHSNVRVITGVRVKSIGKDHVVTDKGKRYDFKTLVGADGSSSVVRKHLGLKSRIFMGIHFIVPVREDKITLFVQPKLLNSGYVWIFPHNDYVSAGFFFNPHRIDSGQAKSSLETVLKEHGLDLSKAKFEGAPTNCLFKGFRFNNIFLAGDAAGLVSAATGEGIAYALVSGQDIAKNILDDSYGFRATKRLLKFKRRQEMFLWLFEILHSRFLQSLTFRVFLRLMRHPKCQRCFGV